MTNFIELKAIFNSVLTFERYIKNCHAKIFIDNQTAIYAINKMGTSHSDVQSYGTKNMIFF